MAYTTTAQPLLNEVSRTAAFFDGIRTKLRERRLYKATYNSLAALSDRELDDLGLHRAQLHRISLEAAKGMHA